jgi:hypothetical protein
MILAVVDGTERDGELVAHFEPKATRLGVADVMRLRRGPAADQAGQTGYKAKMLFRADPPRLADRK